MTGLNDYNYTYHNHDIDILKHMGPKSKNTITFM